MEYLQYLEDFEKNGITEEVLNLIITGIPSIQKEEEDKIPDLAVLNLIITGLPSILSKRLR